MIKNGKVYGIPLIEYVETKANIEAIAAPIAGMWAYASDTEKVGYYDGSAWQWSDQYLLTDGTLPMDSGANLLPTDASGQNLGEDGHRWDGFFTVIDMDDEGWIGNAADDMRIIFHSGDKIEITTSGRNTYTINEDSSACVPMTATAANINLTGGDNETGDDAGIWFRNEETNRDWSIFLDADENDRLTIAGDDDVCAWFNTAENFIIASGNSIRPETAEGQDLGSSLHRWDLYAQDINMDNGGIIHCTTLGGPIITFDSMGDNLEFTECELFTTGNFYFDVGSGNSPHLVFLGGSHNDDVHIYLADDPIGGRSDLVVQLCDTAGESQLQIQDSNEAIVVSIDSDGNAEFGGTVETDIITESTADTGVTIDTVLIKDGLVDGVDISTHASRHGDGGFDMLIDINVAEPGSSFPGMIWIDTS